MRVSGFLISHHAKRGLDVHIFGSRISSEQNRTESCLKFCESLICILSVTNPRSAVQWFLSRQDNLAPAAVDPLQALMLLCHVMRWRPRDRCPLIPHSRISVLRRYSGNVNWATQKRYRSPSFFNASLLNIQRYTTEITSHSKEAYHTPGAN